MVVTAQLSIPFQFPLLQNILDHTVLLVRKS